MLTHSSRSISNDPQNSMSNELLIEHFKCYIQNQRLFLDCARTSAEALEIKHRIADAEIAILKLKGFIPY